MTPSPFIAVLAAGRARRFGAPKLDELLAGQPVGSWVLNAVSSAGLPAGAVVTGPTPPDFLAAWPDWERLENAAPERGLGSSLALAAQAALQADADGLLVLLADMPLLDATFLSKLAAAKPPAATEQMDGSPGVPALLPRALCERLATMTGDSGAGRFLGEDPATTLIQPPANMLIDIDRPEDLARAAALLGGNRA
ncbi:Purine catabolism protein PucB [Methyloligella halotolerans]|uniref:Purine catabolism protein PucB n=1 Tax=Methyloligella halotolerans TaxID=1177755 RepID=A0A1E2RXA1_9HYPH|nr:NTP transferase domain-containing protein [Methyloligella halotolerans]ODA66760.1 Purine catabolism protein PucB [Methyloligella halotolerans]